MLAAAFNALTRLHSSVAQLKRLGTPDFYSPCRITPSNYFRFTAGFEETTVRGREFIIPLSALSGHFSQTLAFSAVPMSGGFDLSIGATFIASVAYNTTSVSLQMAIRLLPDFSNVVVTGDFSAGFAYSFVSSSVSPAALVVSSNTLQSAVPEAVVTTITTGYLPWTGGFMKRGDRIIDSQYGMQTVDDIIEMHDIGGKIMGYRVRVEQ